ncbi:limonene hydroxylase [Metabacillus sp. 113a]|uniref:limonene hydroxylase n=1 Tax=Metabacillus sp. 113a TaxID=3404706 RepID=UPI003CF98477
MFRQLLNRNFYPWMGKKSLYTAVKANLDGNGKLQNEALPDDEEFWEGEPVRWVSGGLDGALGHHASPDENQAAAAELVDLLAMQSHHPSRNIRRKLYLLLMKEDVLSMIDEVLESLRKKEDVDPSNLYEEAYWFASKGAHRNPVKFGIALLGLFQTDDHLELIMTLGKHDEFTLFSATAIQNSSSGNEKLFELAKSVDGWGKIHLVERLSPNTQEIKDWLLLEGYKNDIMHEYLAYTCAVNGELHKAIASKDLDPALYEGAGGILSALISGGPAEDIDDYEHAPFVTGEYLRHSERLCHTLEHLAVILDLHQFLSDEEGWMDRHSNQWSNGEQKRQLQICERIMNHAHWEALIWLAVKAPDSSGRQHGYYAARMLGVDLWEELFSQLQTSPLDEGLYFELMKTDNQDRVQILAAFAEAHLPLDEIAAGPQEEMGLGEELQAHSCLDFILQELDRFEGTGHKLISAGLNSAVVRNRNMALNALEEWPVSSWNPQLMDDVKKLYEIEPDPSLKERFGSLIEAKNLA